MYVTFEWEPSAEPELQHYLLYWGTSSGTYAQNENIPKETSPQSAPNIPNPPTFNGTTTVTNSSRPTRQWESGGEGNGTFRYKLDDSDLTSGATQTTDTYYTPDMNYQKACESFTSGSAMIPATGQILGDFPTSSTPICLSNRYIVSQLRQLMMSRYVYPVKYFPKISAANLTGIYPVKYIEDMERSEFIRGTGALTSKASGFLASQRPTIIFLNSIGHPV